MRIQNIVTGWMLCLSVLAFAACQDGLVNKPEKQPIEKRKITAQAKQGDEWVDLELSQASIGGFVESSFMYVVSDSSPRFYARAKFFDPMDIKGKRLVEDVLATKGSKNAGDQIMIAGMSQVSAPSQSTPSATVQPEEFMEVGNTVIPWTPEIEMAVQNAHDQGIYLSDDELIDIAMMIEQESQQENQDKTKKEEEKTDAVPSAPNNSSNPQTATEGIIDISPLGKIVMARRKQADELFYEVPRERYDLLPPLNRERVNQMNFLSLMLSGGGDVQPKCLGIACDNASTERVGYFNVALAGESIFQWALGEGTNLGSLDVVDRSKPFEVKWVPNAQKKCIVETVLRRKHETEGFAETMVLRFSHDDGISTFSNTDLARINSGNGYIILTRICMPDVPKNNALLVEDGKQQAGLLGVIKTQVAKRLVIQ